MDYTFNPGDEGCYLDGAFGWHNMYRVVDFAVDYGMTLDATEQEALRLYKGDDAGEYTLDIVHELADKATDYLQSITDPGMTWEWDAGELCLMTDEGRGEWP